MYDSSVDITPMLLESIVKLQESGVGDVDLSGLATKAEVGTPLSALSGYTYSSVTDWFNDLEKRATEQGINAMGKKYMASGSISVYSGSISNNTNVITMISNPHDFKVGHGIAIRTSDGAKQVETLKINTGATTSGTLTIKLDGDMVLVGVTAGDTAIQVADKIREVATNGDGSPIGQDLAGSGWSVDTNAVGSTDTLTFNHSNQGTKVAGTFSGASTGVTGTFTVTTTGADTTSFVSKITNIEGNKFTLRDTYTGTTVINKRIDHDDTEAIQNAINDASTNFGTGTKIGGKVIIPPYRFQVTQLKLKSRVILQGVGWRSKLMQRGNTNIDALVLDTSSEEMVVVRDICIDGGKLGQSAGGGINFDNTGGSNFSFYDPVHVFENVLIMNVKNDGFTLSGTREARVSNVFVYSADGHGFNITATDCFFEVCTSAGAGYHGWKLNTPNTRIATCKAYGSGRLDSSANGDGFFITGHRHNLTNCEVQDNGRHGFHFYGGSNNIVEGLMADSNGNRYSGSSAGIVFANGASNNKLTGHALNRTGYIYQKYGLSVNTDCTGNVVHLIAQNNNNIFGEIVAGQGAGNTIVINNLLGFQTPAYAASYTPVIYAGGTIAMTLTGNITINNTAAGHYHTGAKMKLILKQDATGGRTVTFGNLYKTNWTPDTGANKTNIIEFIFDGTNWIQVSATVGI